MARKKKPHGNTGQSGVRHLGLSEAESALAFEDANRIIEEKIEQEKKNPEDIAKGIVKFLVDVYDETGETVAIATILTMVKKRNQN